jgi:hypothetical protein
MVEFSKSVDWFIRGIFNKDGRAEFSIWFYNKGVAFNDVPWAIYYGDSDGWTKEVLEHYDDYIEKKSYSTPSYSYPPYPGNGGNVGGVDYSRRSTRVIGGTFPSEGRSEPIGLHTGGESEDEIYVPGRVGATIPISKHSASRKGAVEEGSESFHRRKVTVYP